MSHLIETMAFVRDTPWHSLGNQLSVGSPIETWLTEAGTRETRAENVSPQAQHVTETGLWETIRTAVCEIVADGAEVVIAKLTALASTLFGWLH